MADSITAALNEYQKHIAQLANAAQANDQDTVLSETRWLIDKFGQALNLALNNTERLRLQSTDTHLH